MREEQPTKEGGAAEAAHTAIGGGIIQVFSKADTGYS